MGLSIEETETALYALEPWEELKGDEVISNKEAWEKEQGEKEKQRILSLSIPQKQFWKYMYPITREQTINKINEIPSTIRETCLSDIYLENYIRGSILIDVITTLYDKTDEEMDELFNHKE